MNDGENTPETPPSVGGAAQPEAGAPAERPTRPDRPVRAAAAAAPAGPQPPPPGTVYDVFQSALPGVPFQAAMGVMDVLLGVRPSEITQVLTTCKNDERLAFDYLRSLTAVDQEAQGLEVVYHLYSFKHGHNVTLKCLLPLENLRIPSVTNFWKAADWLERECWEMFGVEFIGHPNLEPLLLEEDTVHLHPLRKSHPLAAIEVKQGGDITSGDEGDGDGE